MLCPKCDSSPLLFNFVPLSLNRSKIQNDDINCTFCGTKLVDKIVISET